MFSDEEMVLLEHLNTLTTAIEDALEALADEEGFLVRGTCNNLQGALDIVWSCGDDDLPPTTSGLLKELREVVVNFLTVLGKAVTWKRK